MGRPPGTSPVASIDGEDVRGRGQERRCGRSGRRRLSGSSSGSTYGRDSILGLLSAVLAAVYVGVRGSQGRLRYEARLHGQMEKDAVEMRRRGYRITDEQEHEMPPFGIHYRKVTYELIE